MSSLCGILAVVAAIGAAQGGWQNPLKSQDDVVKKEPGLMDRIRGATMPHVEKAKGDTKATAEHFQGQTKAGVYEAKGETTKANMEKAKGSTKAAVQKAKGAAKSNFEKVKWAAKDHATEGLVLGTILVGAIISSKWWWPDAGQ
jgi:hypothetical protein